MIEIILASDGTQVFAICNRCIAEGPEDANCLLETEALSFVQALQAEGHVRGVSDPGDVDFRA